MSDLAIEKSKAMPSEVQSTSSAPVANVPVASVPSTTTTTTTTATTPATTAATIPSSGPVPPPLTLTPNGSQPQSDQSSNPSGLSSSTPRDPLHPNAKSSSIVSPINGSSTIKQIITSPICKNCKTQNTPLWRRDETGQVLCNACGLFLKLHGRPRPISLKSDVIKSRNRAKHGSNNNNNNGNNSGSNNGGNNNNNNNNNNNTVPSNNGSMNGLNSQNGKLSPSLVANTNNKSLPNTPVLKAKEEKLLHQQQLLLNQQQQQFSQHFGMPNNQSVPNQNGNPNKMNKLSKFSPRQYKPQQQLSPNGTPTAGSTINKKKSSPSLNSVDSNSNNSNISFIKQELKSPGLIPLLPRGGNGTSGSQTNPNSPYLSAASNVGKNGSFPMFHHSQHFLPPHHHLNSTQPPSTQGQPSIPSSQANIHANVPGTPQSMATSVTSTLHPHPHPQQQQQQQQPQHQHHHLHHHHFNQIIQPLHYPNSTPAQFAPNLTNVTSPLLLATSNSLNSSSQSLNKSNGLAAADRVLNAAGALENMASQPLYSHNSNSGTTVLPSISSFEDKDNKDKIPGMKLDSPLLTTSSQSSSQLKSQQNAGSNSGNMKPYSPATELLHNGTEVDQHHSQQNTTTPSLLPTINTSSTRLPPIPVPVPVPPQQSNHILSPSFGPQFSLTTPSQTAGHPDSNPPPKGAPLYDSANNGSSTGDNSLPPIKQNGMAPGQTLPHLSQSPIYNATVPSMTASAESQASAQTIEALKTRISELELVNDLYKSRIMELEAAEGQARQREVLLVKRLDEMSQSHSPLAQSQYGGIPQFKSIASVMESTHSPTLSPIVHNPGSASHQPISASVTKGPVTVSDTLEEKEEEELYNNNKRKFDGETKSSASPAVDDAKRVKVDT